MRNSNCNVIKKWYDLFLILPLILLEILAGLSKLVTAKLLFVARKKVKHQILVFAIMKLRLLNQLPLHSSY
jgi:hypothetical protein